MKIKKVKLTKFKKKRSENKRLFFCFFLLLFLFLFFCYFWVYCKGHGLAQLDFFVFVLCFHELNCNGYRYNYHFYSLTVGSGFYGDIGRVTGFFTKLSNRDSG